MNGGKTYACLSLSCPGCHASTYKRVRNTYETTTRMWCKIGGMQTVCRATCGRNTYALTCQCHQLTSVTTTGSLSHSRSTPQCIVRRSHTHLLAQARPSNTRHGERGTESLGGPPSVHIYAGRQLTRRRVSEGVSEWGKTTASDVLTIHRVCIVCISPPCMHPPPTRIAKLSVCMPSHCPSFKAIDTDGKTTASCARRCGRVWVCWLRGRTESSGGVG